MNAAQLAVRDLAAWIAASSIAPRTPFGGETLIGPFAVLVPCDFAAPPAALFDPQGLPIWLPAEQAEGVALPTLETGAPPSQDQVWARLAHILWRIGEGTLPRAAVVGLIDASEPPEGAVERAGAGAVDRTALPMLCVPLWGLPVARRVEIAVKLPMIPA